MIDNFIDNNSLNLIKEAHKKKQFLHIPSRKGNVFKDLMPWKEINRILRQHRLRYPRLRLCMDDKTIKEDEFIDMVQSRKGPIYTRITEEKLYPYLQNGATLIINGIDELYEELDFFVGNLERLFKSSIQANCYMSWGTTKCFNTHWDFHDVLVFQVHGRKKWSVFEDNIRSPLFKDHHIEGKPPQKPFWESIIKESDILFIPRGFWHHAVALNEPSLHLTLGVDFHTGVDYVSWLGEKLALYEEFRKDIPLFAEQGEIDLLQEEFKNKLVTAMETLSLQTYLKSQASNFSHRARFSLPQAGSSSVKLSFKSKLILNIPHISDYKITKEKVSFFAKQKKYEFSFTYDPLFKLLSDYEFHEISEVISCLEKKIDLDSLEKLLSPLVTNGLIALVNLNDY